MNTDRRALLDEARRCRVTWARMRKAGNGDAAQMHERFRRTLRTLGDLTAREVDYVRGMTDAP